MSEDARAVYERRVAEIEARFEDDLKNPDYHDQMEEASRSYREAVWTPEEIAAHDALAARNLLIHELEQQRMAE